MNNTMWLSIGFGAIAGVIIAVVVLKKIQASVKERDCKPGTLDELVKDQLTCDELNMSNVISWFRENAGKASGEAVFFLAKPTVQMAEMFAVTADIRQLDQEHNLLQVVVDQKEKLPVAVRLIACNSKPDLIVERMKDKDYMIITNK